MSFAMLMIDDNQTRKNARGKLQQYRKLQRITGRPAIDLKSPIITDLPKSQSIDNNVDVAILQRVDAERERDIIVDALARLSYKSRTILYYSFCDMNNWSNYKIGVEMGYSEKNIERLKSIALIEFAEAYRGGTLLEPFQK